MDIQQLAFTGHSSWRFACPFTFQIWFVHLKKSIKTTHLLLLFQILQESNDTTLLIIKIDRLHSIISSGLCKRYQNSIPTNIQIIKTNNFSEFEHKKKFRFSSLASENDKTDEIKRKRKNRKRKSFCRFSFLVHLICSFCFFCHL